MATYYSDVGGGATIFTGYTAASGSGCVSQSLTTAVASTAAVPHAPHKQVIKPATGAFCSSSVKMKLTNNQSTGWWGAWSFARPTAYTAAMQISPVSLNANFKKATGHKVWMDAYNSAGVVQASVQIGSRSSTGSTSINSIAVSTTKVVTVPANGFLVLRIDYKPSTGKGSGKGEIKWGQTAATSGLKFVTTETPAATDVIITGVAGSLTYTGQAGIVAIAPAPRTASATLHDSTGTAIPNGVRVHAFLASDFGGAGTMTSLGSGLTTGGTGSVSITVLTASNVVLQADMLSASVPAGEVVVTDEITPVL